MLKKFKNNIHILLIIFVWVLFASPFIFFGKTPYPADYQVNSFSPISSYPGFAGPIKNNAQPDIISQIYPWRHFDIQELKNGRLPFWNPYSFGGTPHLANYQSAVLFPLNILFLLPVPFIDVWSFLVVLQPLLAGIFVYLMARKLGISKAGSTMSSFSFMFCGFITTWMGYATLGYAILPLPIAVYAIEKYIEIKKQLWLIILSLTFMFSYFSGHFQMSIYFSIAIFGYIAYGFFSSRNKQVYIECLLFALIGLFLAMPQILPSIEFYSQSVRSSLFQKVEAIPLNYLATLIAPDFYGNPVTRNDWFGHYAEWSSFAGAIPFALAFFTLLFNRTKKTLFFIMLAAFSLLLSLDTPFLSLIVLLKIPVLSTSAASRSIVLFSFSIAVLGGFGFDNLLNSLKERKKSVLVWVVAILILLLGVGVLTLLPILPHEKNLIARKNFLLPASTLLLFLVLSSFLLLQKKPRYVLLFSAFVLFLSGFEMYRFASKWQSYSPKGLVYPHVAVSDFYSKQSGYDRAIGMSGGEDAVYYNIPALNGYDPLYSARYGEFVRFVATGQSLDPERSVVNFPLDGKYTPDAINFLGVRFIVHKVSDGSFPWAFPFRKYPLNQFTKVYDDSHYQIFENKTAFPRAYPVSNLTVLNKKAEIMDFMFSHDLKKTAVVEEKMKDIDGNSVGTAQILEYFSNKVTMKTSATGNMLLILTDNFYPGWKAYVNGISSPIYRIDYSFRGVIIPKGESKVVMTYVPESFLVGVYLFLIGILGMTTSIIFKKLQLK